MRLQYKISLVAAIVVALGIGSALIVLGVVARSRGVSRVPLPAGSLIDAIARDSDYADSYAATVPDMLFPDTRALDRFAFQKCAPAGETGDEIMYTGESPGLVYHVSYLRRREGAETRFYVSTSVRYKSRRGRLYFAFVRPVHRVLTPFMVSVMIGKARTAAT